MNIFFDENGLGKKCCIAIGMFDGMHKAHMEIMRECAEFAQNSGGTSYVYTFRPRPKPSMKEQDYIMLSTLDQKLSLIESTGIENAVVMDFNDEYASATHEQFIRRLCKGRRVKAIFCGYDFRFGNSAAGNTQYLKEMASKLRYRVFVKEPVMHGENVLSSSLIRRELMTGSFDTAIEMLGRPYTAQMTVHSRKLTGSTTYIHGVLAKYYDIANGQYAGKLHFFEDRIDCDIYAYNKTIRLSIDGVDLEGYTARLAEIDFIKRQTAE